ncbi:MAG: VWA domain-containing protein [Myxococcales bacterium]|nr:VWA domain-containing protein [Myxococcales bacterium]MCB9583107.1 VWA domain-containing protein [Polyangiaceae bacterium]
MLRARSLIRWAAAMALFSAPFVACGGEEPDNLVSPCDGALKDQCGAACTGITDCAAGLYCGADKKCTADCTPGGGQCGAGKQCDNNGRCTTGIVIPDGGNGDGSSADGCIKVDVTFEKQTPTVVLLIDQSGSMSDNFGGQSRWKVVHDALMDPSTGIVKNLENEIRFGLALYTSDGGSAGGKQCPVLTEVSMKLGNYAAIKAVYDPAGPEGDTPTGESIDKVVTTLAPYTEPGPKVIVLATDGEPDTCAEPNPQNGQPEAIKAAQDAFKKDIRTYIISVGDQVSLGHLQDMANAGQGLAVGGSKNATYYQALDQNALKKAFEEIIYGVRPCTFTLNGTVDPADAGKGTVLLDGKPLGYQDADGWKLNPPSEVELTGAACQAIKTGDHSVSIDFPCGVFVPADPR